MGAEFCQVRLAQRDGNAPAILASGSAPGESGVTVLSAHFQGGAHFLSSSARHLIFFTSQARIACRLADSRLCCDMRPGGLAVCPAGVDGEADVNQSLSAVVIAVDRDRLALAAAEDAAVEGRLGAKLEGYDQELLDLARGLVCENARGYPSGALFWNEAASRFIDRLVARHVVPSAGGARGTLGCEVLARLRDHILANLDEPIEVTALARIAGRSPFHFSRVFAKSVGMTPHRYVVHLRLRRAIELMREGRAAPAEIAARTGFADQSHLSRWVRRVHGVPLGTFGA